MGKNQGVAKVVWLYKRPGYMPDLAEAFIRLGWQAELKTEREMMKAMYLDKVFPTMVITNLAMSSRLEDKDYITVYSLCMENRIPFVWWLWDSWFISPDLKTQAQQAGATRYGLPLLEAAAPQCPDGPYLWTFSVNKDNLRALKGRHVEYLPFGVNERRFRPMGLPPVYPVGFIGTSLIGERIDGYAEFERLGLLDGNGSATLNFEDEPTAESWRLLCSIRASAIARADAATAVHADTWGNGWDKLAEAGDVRHHGLADWGTALPEIINMTDVSLNVSKLTFPRDICPRLLELAACGAKIISNRLPGIQEEFGGLVKFYDDMDDLKSGVAWLQKGGLPVEVMRKGARRLIEEKWTWVRRAERICEVVGV